MAEKYVFGFKIREPSESEKKFFKEKPHVSGYAAEDEAIVLSPYTKLNTEQLESVAQNEAVRLWLRKKNIDPPFKLTPEQVEAFKGTEYEGNSTALKQSILGRIISKDASMGNITYPQQMFADWVLQNLKQRDLK